MDPTLMKEGFEQALLSANDGLTLQDVEFRLFTGQALLWTGTQSALVTELINDEDGLSLHVWLGTGDIDELLSLEPGVSAWARARGCKYASIDGRKGWARLFKPLGFNFVNGELRKYYV